MGTDLLKMGQLASLKWIWSVVFCGHASFVRRWSVCAIRHSAYLGQPGMEIAVGELLDPMDDNGTWDCPLSRPMCLPI